MGMNKINTEVARKIEIFKKKKMYLYIFNV